MPEIYWQLAQGTYGYYRTLMCCFGFGAMDRQQLHYALQLAGTDRICLGCWCGVLEEWIGDGDLMLGIIFLMLTGRRFFHMFPSCRQFVIMSQVWHIDLQGNQSSS